MKLPKGSLDILRRLTAEEKAILKFLLKEKRSLIKLTCIHKQNAELKEYGPHLSAYGTYMMFLGKLDEIEYLTLALFNMWLKTKNESIHH